MPAGEVAAWVAASKGVPQDPEGSLTCGTPEAHHACPPHVAKEAGEPKERPVQRGEAVEPSQRPVSREGGWRLASREKGK
jgi:hypothetical protein